jgi:CRISPR-associated protein (TIGR03984 family)
MNTSAEASKSALEADRTEDSIQVANHDGITAGEAIALLDTPIASIGWSPSWAGFLVGAPPDDIYELRSFDENTEVRWYRSPDGETTCRSISEESLATGAAPCAVVKFDLRITGGTALVWGTGTGGHQVQERQTGPLNVPLEVPMGAQLELGVIEYAAKDPSSGTALILEERLVSLEVMTARAQVNESTTEEV